MAALAVRLDARHEALNAIDHAVDVDAHDPVPVFIGRLVHRAEDADTGIVADQVHLAEHAQRLVRRPLHRLAIGDIQLDGVHVAADAAEFPQRTLQMIGTDVGDGDLHAGCR